MSESLSGSRFVLFRNVGLKAFSVLLAVGLWYAVNVAGRDTEVTVTVPVKFHGMADDLVLSSHPIHSVQVWIAGPRGVLQTVTDGRLELDYDLSTVGTGIAEFSVDRHDLRIPDKARLVRVWPARFAVQIQRRQQTGAGEHRGPPGE